MENTEKKNAWLEERKKYITGTDASAIMGLSPWANPLTVYLDKKGLGEPVVENEAMRWGLRLENTILQAYADTMCCKLINVDGYDLKTNDEYPRLACSLDGWNADLKIPVDAKNIRYCDGSKWGENGSEEIPHYYKVQLHVQMMIMNARMAHLAVLFSGQDFRIYQVNYDEELAKAINDSAEAFWARYMSDGSAEQPMPTADASQTETIKKVLAKGVKDKKVDATEEIIKVAKTLVSVKARSKELADKEAVLSNRIKLFMSDATICEGEATWKNNKDTVKTDWQTLAEHLLEGMTAEERESIVKNFTVTTPGNRVLRITVEK